MQLNNFIEKYKNLFLCVLQTMVDWNWLCVIGELGASYGFYRWWQSKDTFLAVLEVELWRLKFFL
jgi:hypothetical protein